MKKTLILSALLVSAAATAQNLNPVVEVTNIYAREATGIEKPEQLRALPDSVFKFNLDFDYSVKSTPYKGAYEFNPYLVQLRPAARLSGEHTLYLKAGAGFTVHPELDVVWNPFRTRNLRVDIYAVHNSYWGGYRGIGLQEGMFDYNGKSLGTGLGSRTKAGIDFLAAYKGGRFTAYSEYSNVAATDFYLQSNPSTRLSHKGQVQLRFQSNPGTRFLYNVGTRVTYLIGPADKEFHTVSDVSLGVRMGKNNALRLMGGFETVSFDGETGFKVEVAPHYTLGTKRWNLDLGVKYSYIGKGATAYQFKGGVLFPDVHVSFRIADAAVLQAAVTGGDRLVTYESLLEDNLYVNGFDWYRDVIVTRFDAMGGIRGSIGGKFSYDIKGGYKWMDNAYAWSYTLDGSGRILPGMTYASPLKTAYVNARIHWNSENLDVMAFASYGYTPKPNLRDTDIQQNLFVPAPFRANGHIFYKWGGRIKVGPTVEIRSKMKGRNGGIPGYVDLGLYAEYSLGRKLGFWVKGGNFLNQTIQRTPFYAEGGVFGSAGVKLLL